MGALPMRESDLFRAYGLTDPPPPTECAERDCRKVAGHGGAHYPVPGDGTPDSLRGTTGHRQHSDNPTDTDPRRPGRHCGPDCDLYEPADR